MIERRAYYGAEKGFNLVLELYMNKNGLKTVRVKLVTPKYGQRSFSVQTNFNLPKIHAHGLDTIFLFSELGLYVGKFGTHRQEWIFKKACELASYDTQNRSK